MKKTELLCVIILCSLVPILLNGQYLSWVSRYNGPVASDYNDDEPTAIAVDNQGNVYVTGKSVGLVQYPYSYYDFATIKYYPNGDTAWVRRYNGPANRDDYAHALAVDASGNVYVTGSSYISDSINSDYFTIKYNSNGDTVWTRRYNGSDNYLDEAYAIAVDNQGNVYVTGYSSGSSSWSDYTTIKYNTNGDTIWVRRYNGSFNSTDEASAIAVDNQGNVYVTGKSYGPGYWYDYVTIKYNSSGDTSWVRRYTYAGNNNDEARAIAVDNNGNVYVTGQSMQPGAYDGGDCATIKYNSNGDTVWVRRYNGTASDWDEGKDIAVDNYGNVYVTGVTSVPGQYYSLQNYLTIKYNSTGTQQWIQKYNQPDSTSCYNIASAIALDASGNIYVTGLSGTENNGNDYATVKYTPTGTQQWVVRYDGPGHSDDDATAMTIDLAGNVYVTGYSINSSWNYDYATIKYYPAFANDVGIDTIIYPQNTHLISQPMIPIAIVKNYGTSTQNSFSAVCSIIGSGGVVRYTNTQTISSLAGYDTVRVSFAPWPITATEVCMVIIRTNLAGDQNLFNDRKMRNVIIVNYQNFFSEGFNEVTFPPLGWQNIIVNGSYEWERKTSNNYPNCTPYEGSAMASFQSYDAPESSCARLISPPINLGIIAYRCSLKFNMYHDNGYSASPDSVKIEYSTNGTSFTQVASFRRYRSGTAAWSEHSVYLGMLSGTVYIGLLGFSGYGNNMNIDNVRLTGTPQYTHDVGIDAVHSPQNIHPVNTVMNIKVRVKNYGLSYETFPVVCSILGTGGVLRYTNTTSSSLAAGDTVQVNFPSYTPAVPEALTLIIRTSLASDQNPSNDRVVITLNVGHFVLYLNEGFNSTTFPPSGWQSIIVNGTYNWERKTSNNNPPCMPYEGAAMASYQSWDAYEGEMARLISPAINFGTVPNSCSLNFFMYHDSGNNDCYDFVRIEYSTNGTTFYPVDSFLRYQPGTPTWTGHSVYLGALSGTAYLGILAYSDYGNNMNIDNIRLFGLTGITEQENNNHLITTLYAPRPNPAVKIAKIAFSLATREQTFLKIFDRSGRLVKILVSSELPPGIYNYIWHGKDEQERTVAEGVYFYSLETPKQKFTKKLILTR